MIVKEILPNGITLLTEAMPHVRSVAVGVWLKRGSRHETPLQSGISHFIEHMVFKGTKNRSAEVIAAQVDSIGGHMDAFTAKEYASFHLKVLDEHLPMAVDILGDIVANPLFDPEEMAKEKKVIFEEINMVEDTPDDLVMELLTEAFWPRHPLGRPILGTKKSVSSFKRHELASFFHDVYRTYAMRARLLRNFGTAANQVLWRGQVPLVGDSTFADQAVLAADKWASRFVTDKRDLGRNGTYLIFRDLRQDVRGFWQFLDAQAASAGATRQALRRIRGQPNAPDHRVERGTRPQPAAPACAALPPGAQRQDGSGVLPHLLPVGGRDPAARFGRGRPVRRGATASRAPTRCSAG